MTSYKRRYIEGDAQSTGPLVSIVVPVYNVERYVDCCLTSIRAQTYSNIEIIVVDDCSTDSSMVRLTPHCRDARVRLIQHQANAGLSAARNTGIGAARGDYLMFVDADDVVAETIVEACVEHAGSTDADVVSFDFVSFVDGEVVPEAFFMMKDAQGKALQREDFLKMPHFAWLKFIHRRMFTNSRLLFPVGCYYEDWPFHWELGFAAERIEHLPIVGCGYRLRSGSITASRGKKFLDIFIVQRKLHAILEHYNGDSCCRNELRRKCFSSASLVLTRIDREHLHHAVKMWKANYSELRGNTMKPTVKGCFAVLVGLLPENLGYLLVLMVRKGLRV